MMVASRKLVAGFAGLITVTFAVLYGSIAFSLSRQSPAHLLACMETEARWRAWTCEQVLRHAAISEQQVIELNRQAGVRLPAALAQPEQAEEMLKVFLAHGVEINAPDHDTRGWTALHGFVAERSPDKVALLLKHGASTHVADAAGMTPIELANKLSRDYPGDANVAAIISLLGAGAK